MKTFTLHVEPLFVNVIPGKSKDAKRWYRGKTCEYYLHGRVTGRRDAIMSKMLSHAYEHGETIMSLSKWVEREMK